MVATRLEIDYTMGAASILYLRVEKPLVAVRVRCHTA